MIFEEEKTFYQTINNSNNIQSDEGEEERTFEQVDNTDKNQSEEEEEEEEENTFDQTYSRWTQQEDEWLWEQFREGKTIIDYCNGLDRYPDDVITYMCTHSVLQPEYINGFGGPCHLALWKKQKEAFETNPLFNCRKEIRQAEYNDKIFDILRNIQMNMKYK